MSFFFSPNCISELTLLSPSLPLYPPPLSGKCRASSRDQPIPRTDRSPLSVDTKDRAVYLSVCLCVSVLVRRRRICAVSPSVNLKAHSASVASVLVRFRQQIQTCGQQLNMLGRWVQVLAGFRFASHEYAFMKTCVELCTCLQEDEKNALTRLDVE